MSSTTMQIQEIYVGLLGRAADAEGLAYWKAEIDGGVLSIEELRANIVNEQPEYAANLGSLSRTDLVTELYSNLFNRAPDAEGLSYWVTGGGSTVNADQLVLALVNGAAVADEAVLANRTEVANYYTDSGVTYDASAAASAIANVDGSDASVQTAKSDISLLASAASSELTEGGTFDYSGSGPVSVTISGDEDATDGDDFVITGSKFNDTFILSKNDFRELTIAGGDGVDTLDVSDDKAVVNALTGRANFDGNTTNIAEFTSIERFVFDDEDDTFTGGSASETIVAGGGNDNLDAGAGDDTFIFKDTDELAEVVQVMEGGIGTDTLQIGVKDDSGYKVDLTLADTALTSSGIENLVVTGKEADGTQVYSSTITIDNATSDITNVTGATTKDKIVLESAATVDLGSWTFANIAEVKTESGVAQAVTVEQSQLSQVKRWVADNASDTLVLEVDTGVSSQTWDLTGNYFNGWAGLDDTGSVKTTLVVDQATLAGFANDSASEQYEITLDSGDTLSVKGDADLSPTLHSVGAASLVIDGNVIVDNDAVSTTRFDTVTGADGASLTFTGGAVDLSGVTLVDLDSIVGASSSETFALSAATSGLDGLTISSKGKIIFNETGKSITEDYADYAGLTLTGSNVSAEVNGQVALDQDTVSGLKSIVGVTGTDNDIWVSSDLNLSTITTLTNVAIQDSSANNAITGASTGGTYNFTKGGTDTFTSSGKDDTLTITASSGTVTADMGAGANTLAVGVTTAGAAADAVNVTATFGTPGGKAQDVDVNSNSTGTVDLTFADFTKTGDSADVKLLGKGAQTVTFGDILAGNDTDHGVDIDLEGTGAKTVVGGTGFFDIDLDNGTGAVSITLGDGGHNIAVDNDSTDGVTGGSYTGNIALVVGENLDNDAGSDIGVINLSNATGTNTIETGKGGWTITAGAGLDTITAGSGDDTITAGKGGDVINISAGGADTIIFDTTAVASGNDSDAAHADQFTGYSTLTGFAAASSNGDKIQVTNIDTDNDNSHAASDSDNDEFTFASFATDGLTTSDNDDVYIFSGDVTSLTDVDVVIDAIGNVANDSEEFYVVLNDDGGDVFGLYQINLATTHPAVASGNDIDVTTGNSIKLLGIVDGNVTLANADNYFDFG